jgi:Xaa-Pro aminopeptidase
VDPKYWDLGVRVEDTYLVTPDGYEELTSFPKIPER